MRDQPIQKIVITVTTSGYILTCKQQHFTLTNGIYQLAFVYRDPKRD